MADPASPPGDVFCQVVERGDPDELVWADDDVVVFLDIAPLQFGHLLVVPRRHVVTLEQLAYTELAPLFSAVQRASVAVREAMDAPGVFVANNTVVSQSVPHLHVHVVPRRPGDGLRGFFWPRRRYEDDAHAAAVRDRVRAAMASVAPAG